jgi:hypothetical protein
MTPTEERSPPIKKNIRFKDKETKEQFRRDYEMEKKTAAFLPKEKEEQRPVFLKKS